MKPEQVLSEFEELKSLEAVSPYWSDSEAFSSDSAKMDALLSPREIEENALYCGLERSAVDSLLSVASRISASPSLRRFLGHVYHTVFIREGHPPPAPTDWPLLAKPLGPNGSCLYLIAAAAWSRILRAQHKRQGVPADVTKATAGQVACFLGNHLKGKGVPGMYVGQCFWLRNYVWGNLYLRLGRFEFWLKPYNGFDIVCRSKKDAAKIVNFARPGLKIGADGHALDDAASAPEHVWTTSSGMDESFVFGNPVAPDGRPARERLSLPLSDWEIVLKNGTQVLDMHIPAGGGMSPEDCQASFRKAKGLFAELAPGRVPAAVVCSSWIFNPNLPDFLPESSNLVKLLKSVRLFPIASGPTDGLWFVFLMDKFDVATAPRETSLQRAILDYIAAGKRWRSGGMFLLLGEIR